MLNFYNLLLAVSPISGDENVLDKVGNVWDSIVQKVQQGLDSTQIDDDIVNFFSKVKDDQQVQTALSNVGGDLKDAVTNIFNDIVYSDYDKLKTKLKKGGLFESIPGLKVALENGKRLWYICIYRGTWMTW